MEETEKKKVYELAQIPTNHTLVILTPEGEQMTFDEAMVHLLNEVKELREIMGKA